MLALGTACKTSRRSDWRWARARATKVVMDQITLGLDPLPKKTCKEVFLGEMNQAVPWAELVAPV